MINLVINQNQLKGSTWYELYSWQKDCFRTFEQMRKKNLFTIFLFLISLSGSFACELCKQNQPKPLENITHGTGPQSDWDYVIIIAGIIIVSLTFIYSLKFLIKPRETDPSHIKNIVIDKGW